MALSLLAKLLMMERDSWKRELPVSATSEISWLTAMMICREKEGNGIYIRKTGRKIGNEVNQEGGGKKQKMLSIILYMYRQSQVRASEKLDGLLILC